MAKVTSLSRRVDTHTVTEVINGVQHEFEVQFEPNDYKTISVAVSKSGKRAVVGYITRDDCDPQDPRKDWDQIDHMICFHNRYSLGDEHRYGNSDYFVESLCREAIGDDDTFDRMLENLDKRIDKVRGNRGYNDRSYWQDIDELRSEFYNKILEKHYVMLPLYLYDHSGITISTSSFSCPWDSGQVGYIYMSRQEILDNWGGKILTKQLKQKAAESMKSSVKTYDQLLTGDLWGVCYQTFINVAEDGDDPEWEEDERVDECWGFFGDDYAEDEMLSGFDYWKEHIEKPLPAWEDPNQLNLFQEAA